MTGCSGTKIYDGTGDVLRLAQSLVRVCIGKSLCTTSQSHQAVGHLCREEARSNAVAEDASGAQLDGQVACEMECCGLGGAVSGCCVLSQRPDPNARDRCCDKYAGGLC